MVASRRALLASMHLVLSTIALAAAKKEVDKTSAEPLSPAEIAHKRHFFSIGEGFEGTASDWTEYIVWVLGVIGVFYYMANPNARRNLHAINDDDGQADFRQQSRHGADGDELFEDDVVDLSSSPSAHGKTD